MHIIRKHRSGRAVGAMAIDVKTIQHQETTPRIKQLGVRGGCRPNSSTIPGEDVPVRRSRKLSLITIFFTNFDDNFLS